MDASNTRDLTLLTEVARRAIVLGLFVLGATLGFGYGQVLLALASALAGSLTYIFLPRPRIPHGALHHDRMPTVIMPDLLGFMLATVFFALPLVVSAQEPGMAGWGLYLLTGLPGLIACFIFWVALRHQCLWLVLTGHDLTIADLRHVETLAFRDIEKVEIEVKPPPRWLKPLLILFGGWRGLGIALLTGERPSHALAIRLTNGTRRRIPADAFPDQRALAAALARGGVALDGTLGGLARKTARRRGPRPAGAGKHHRTGSA